MSAHEQTEHFQETLLHLEKSRRKESKLRHESDAILTSLSALVSASNRSEVLAVLRNTFHSLTGCDDCWVLQHQDGQLVTENNKTFPVGKGFLRVLNGGSLNAFDVKQVPEWRDIDADNICSAMHLPLTLSAKQGMLILTSSKPAAFTRESIELAKRIIPLTEQALAKIKQTEQAHAAEMKNQWQMMRLIMDHAPIGIYMINKQHQVQFVNQAFCDLVGIAESRFIAARHYAEILPAELAQQCMASDTACFEQNAAITVRETIITPDGNEHIINTTKVPLHDTDGTTYALIGISIDITEQLALDHEKEQMQEQMLHAQKLESMGILAGGIAHDFNNILAAIMGHASLAESKCKRDPQAVEGHLLKIASASEKAAALCTQMLAYSGHGQFVVKAMDVSQFVESILNILEVSLNKGVVLKLSLNENLPMVEADTSQIQQVIMNLITNANEAIASISGIIAIRTGIMNAEKDYLMQCLCAEEIQPGHFVFIEVSDTGCGMSEAIIEKIFDPFFTTKFTGRGLGMSAVMGIIRGHQGALKLYTEPGQGSTFRVLLPASSYQCPDEHSDEDKHLLDSGINSVLVVDDEESIREITSMMLEDAGINKILTAEDGRQALEVYKRENKKIDLIILDLTMPHMDGEETFRQLRLLNPDVKVILASGYSQQSVQDRFAGKGLCGFLQKPFTLEMLNEAVKAALTTKGD